MTHIEKTAIRQYLRSLAFWIYRNDDERISEIYENIKVDSDLTEEDIMLFEAVIDGVLDAIECR